ncbi:MAG: GYF domain-containing protein [Phycisphaerae bacterium]
MADWYCYVLSRRYGPVDIETLRRWVREGRLTARDLVWSEDLPQWTPVRDVPQLAVAVAQPAAAPPPVRPTTPAGLKPDRGVLVLVLSAVGLATCFVVSLIALVLALTDLKEMKAGIMDPEGKSLTQVGLVLAIVGLVKDLAVGTFWFMLPGAFC